MCEPDDDQPIARDAYEALAERYAALIDDKAHNAHYERPAMLALLPDVAGRRVLDAGCGPGVYTAWLVEHGADVLALDVSPKMVALARQRVGAAADIRQADLNKPLDFLDAGSFDLVLAPLVPDYVRDWGRLFGAFSRALRPRGLFVFSGGHPMYDFRFSKTGRYFDTEIVATPWYGFGGDPVTVPFFRRPLSAAFDALWAAGFVVERVVEPRPTPTFKEKEPDDYEKLMKQPGFICIRARKDT